MNKQILKFVFALLFIQQGQVVCAQSQRLIVWMKSGEKVYYDLEEEPKTTFEGAEIVITTNTLQVYYPLSEILRYTYELNSSGIDNINKAKHIVISQKGGNMVIKNLRADTLIRIYATDGKLLKSMTADGSQNITIPLVSYPDGVYIVKVDNVVYKLMKR